MLWNREKGNNFSKPWNIIIHKTALKYGANFIQFFKDEDSNGSGICLACSYHCHEGHELVELYTKRQFRCDCGNSKMDNECKLANDKRPENERNK